MYPTALIRPRCGAFKDKKYRVIVVRDLLIFHSLLSPANKVPTARPSPLLLQVAIDFHNIAALGITKNKSIQKA